MRTYAPVTVFRTCTRDVTFKGVEMKAGEKVAMMTTLVNRDHEELEAPNEIRLDRKSRHTAFGFGVHTCISMHLARRELRIAPARSEEHTSDIQSLMRLSHAVFCLK